MYSSLTVYLIHETNGSLILILILDQILTMIPANRSYNLDIRIQATWIIMMNNFNTSCAVQNRA